MYACYIMNVGRVLASKEGEDMNRPVNNAEWLEQLEAAKEWATGKGFTVIEDTDLEDQIIYWKKMI